MPVRGVLIAIAHERVLSFPSRWLQPKPKLCWLVLAVIECPKIQQHTQTVPNPCSTMCLFSPLLKQRTQVCETTKGLVSELRWGAISPLRLDELEGGKDAIIFVCTLCLYAHTQKCVWPARSQWLRCMGVCARAYTVTIGSNPAELTALWWPQPAQHPLMPLAQVSHGIAHGSWCWADLPTCLPARGKAVGQSHFQQINLIWKFSSPCNLKQQQQGSSSPPILNSLRSRLLPFFFFSRSVLTQKELLNERGKGRDRGMDECEKRRREGKRDGGRKAGNYFQRSFC